MPTLQPCVVEAVVAAGDSRPLRGPLPARLDTRSIERAARSACQRLRTLSAASVAPADALATAYGPDAPVGAVQQISPFSRAIGFAFEHHLFTDGAAVLRSLYEHHDGWRPPTVHDLRGIEDRAENEARTIALVEEHLAGAGTPGSLLLGGRLTLQGPTEVTHVHPDLLVLIPSQRLIRVGEAKSYLDLDGRTDPTEVATAVRQAAVAVVALRHRFGVEVVDRNVDLVLRLPRRPGASLRRLDAAAEIAAIAAALRRAPDLLAEATEMLAGRSLATADGLAAIPHRWDASCRNHCALADVCHAEAQRRDDLALLGEGAARALEGVASVIRAIALARGDAPMNAAEERVASALSAGWAASAAAETTAGG